MHDDLEAIANLEFGKAVERISREAHEKSRGIQTMPRGGQMQNAILQVQLDRSEETCRAYAQIWQDLLEAKNGGHLTREDVNFIVDKVQRVAASSKGSLSAGPGASRLPSAGEHIARRVDSVSASIRRDLEIRFRRQKAFPKKQVLSPETQINVTIQNAANVNLGSQMGTINATLTAISDRSHAHLEIASALKEMSEAVMVSCEIQDGQKQEALQVITEIAKQAEEKPEVRSRGALRALIAGLPEIIGFAADVTTLWDKYVPLMRHFFGI
jgi:hypothetical protein